MASEEQTKNSLPAGVRVKVEPGTSASSSISPGAPPETPSASFSAADSSTPRIKTEPSVQPVPTHRLTSFRLPRDLTLGGNIKLEKPKKVYAPNVNVQRNKKQNEISAPKIQHESVRQSNNRKRGRGRGDRGRDRGRGRAQIVESAGVWSEGIFTPAVNRRSSNYSNYSKYSDSDTTKTKAAKHLEEPKLNLNKITDNEEEQEKLRKFLSDDFVDENESDEEKLEPLSLPRVMKNPPKFKEKKVQVDHEFSDLENENKPRTISEMTENKMNSYVLIQFPDRLPNIVSSKEEAEHSRSDDSNVADDSGDSPTGFFDCLKDGFVGKLEILKSGKARLRLGDSCFHVDLSVEGTYHQELMAVKLNTELSTGDSVNLGPVEGKLICSSDLSQIFSSMENLEL